MNEPGSSALRRAVIDVGSNSVKLLVADFKDGNLKPVLERGEQTRLGRGSFETGRLQPVAITDSVQVIRKFYKLASVEGAQSIRVIATSAARDASNGSELVAAANDNGVKLEIVSGEQETQWTCRGALANPLVRADANFVVDVGGGSTEILWVSNKTILAHRSFPIGTVRLLERSALSNPPGLDALAIERERFQSYFQSQVLPVFQSAIANAPAVGSVLVGTGGTPVFLARIVSGSSEEKEPVEQMILSQAAIEGLTERLWSLTMAERKKLPGLPPKRADVILFGALIFDGLMRCLKVAELQPSTWGVRYGVLLDSQ